MNKRLPSNSTLFAENANLCCYAKCQVVCLFVKRQEDGGNFPIKQNGLLFEYMYCVKRFGESPRISALSPLLSGLDRDVDFLRLKTHLCLWLNVLLWNILKHYTRTLCSRHSCCVILGMLHENCSLSLHCEAIFNISWGPSLSTVMLMGI